MIIEASVKYQRAVTACARQGDESADGDGVPSRSAAAMKRRVTRKLDNLRYDDHAFRELGRHVRRSAAVHQQRVRASCSGSGYDFLSENMRPKSPEQRCVSSHHADGSDDGGWTPLPHPPYTKPVVTCTAVTSIPGDAGCDLTVAFACARTQNAGDLQPGSRRARAHATHARQQGAHPRGTAAEDHRPCEPTRAEEGGGTGGTEGSPRPLCLLHLPQCRCCIDRSSTPLMLGA
jgi:hypothetical protein